MFFILDERDVKRLNAACLIVGTSVGAGMLGLPVETGMGGFLPSVLLLFINWVIMTATALLLCEVIARDRKSTNFVSLAGRWLGRPAQVLTFVVYIALFLSLSLAYVKGGGVFITGFHESFTPLHGCLIFLAFFLPLIFLGPRFLGIGNSLLTAGLLGSFLIIALLGVKVVNPELLGRVDWMRGLSSFPMFITSFGFHSVLPSAYAYVGDVRPLRWAVVAGTTITFVIYLVWQMVVLGIVPENGPNGLAATLAADKTAITPLVHFLQSPVLIKFSKFFYFCALTTSFLGVGLGLVDFILDALHLKQKKIYRLLVMVAVYLPAVWIAQSDLRIFYLSLKYGGGSACFYLLILLPILLFWKMKRKEG